MWVGIPPCVGLGSSKHLCRKGPGLVDNRLNTSQNYVLVTKKANRVLGYISKCVASKSSKVFLSLSSALVEVCADSRVLSPVLGSPV